MFERFDSDARLVIARAGDHAERMRWPKIERAHLFLALADVQSDAAALIRRVQPSGDDFETLVERVQRITYSLSLGESAATPQPGHHDLSLDMGRVLTRALRCADDRGHRMVEPLHLLLALAQELRRDPSSAPDSGLLLPGLTTITIEREIAECAPTSKRVEQIEEIAEPDDVASLRRRADELAWSVMEHATSRPTGSMAAVLEALRLEIRAAALEARERG